MTALGRKQTLVKSQFHVTALDNLTLSKAVFNIVVAAMGA